MLAAQQMTDLARDTYGGAMRMRSVLILFALGLVSLGARGDVTRPQKPSKVLIFTTPPGAADREHALALDDVLVTTLGKAAPAGVQVLSAAEVGLVADFDARRQLVGGCTDPVCLSELGTALNTDLIVVPSLRKLETQYVLSVLAVRTTTVELLGREVLYVDDNPEAMVQGMRRLSAISAGFLGFEAPPLELKMSSAPAPLSWQTTAVTATQPGSAQQSEPLQPAQPVARQRLVVIIHETIDGKDAGLSPAETGLSKVLAASGYKLVSSDVARKLHGQQSVALMMEGKLPDEVSTLDADLLLVGKASSTYMGSLIKDVHTYSARLEVKAIRLDSAQIVATESLDTSVGFFARQPAATKALEKVGKKLAPTLVEHLVKLSQGPREIELLVHGVPDRARLSDLRKQLQAHPAVSQVVSRHSSKQATKLELVSKLDADALADALDGTPGLPLEIVQTTRNAMLARYDGTRGIRLGVLLTSPTGKLSARDLWLTDALPELLSSALTNVHFLEPLRSGRGSAQPRKRRPSPATIRKLAATQPGASLVLVPTLRSGKDKLNLAIELFDAHNGVSLFSARDNGSPDDAALIADRLIDKLGHKLLDAVASKGRKRLSPALRMAVEARAAPRDQGPLVPRVRIEAVELADLFPALVSHYQTNPSGWVKLKHDMPDGPAATALRISVFIPSAMSMPSEVTIPELKAGQELEVPVQLTLDSTRLQQFEGHTPAQAEIQIHYEMEGARQSEKRTSSLVIFSRNALDWQRASSVASFVTPQDKSVRGFARAALAATPQGEQEGPALTAITLFEALRLRGMRYVKDPEVPTRDSVLDSVQYARESLAQGTGDCDDLSVLYASLLESAGVESALVRGPGHSLVAFSPGPVEQSVRSLTVDRKRYLVHQGRAWIPLEATLLAEGFEQAWQKAAEQLQRWQKRGELELLPVREAWATYPPTPLPPGDPSPQVQVAALKTLAAESLAQVQKHRDGEVEQLRTRLSRRAAKGKDMVAICEYAVLLAENREFDAAAELLAGLGPKAHQHAELLNNWANLLLLGGDAQIAVSLYKKGLDRHLSGKAAPVHIAESLNNLGLAYLAAGDQKMATEAFSQSISAGGSSLLELVALGVTSDSGRRAGPARKNTSELDRKLADALQQALGKARKQRGQKKPSRAGVRRFREPLPSGGRRGADPQQQHRLLDLLVWQRIEA